MITYSAVVVVRRNGVNRGRDARKTINVWRRFYQGEEEYAHTCRCADIGMKRWAYLYFFLDSNTTKAYFVKVFFS